MSSGSVAGRAGNARLAAPVMSVLLCGALAGVYTWELWVSWHEGPAELEAWIHRLGLVPREWLRGRLLTPLTALFLHASALHLLANLAFLAWFGIGVEPLLGARRFLALFLGCGVVAGLLHVALAPASFVPAVGASGAVSGVVGAWWRLRDRPGTPPARMGRATAGALLALWLVAQLAAGLASGAGDAGWGHLGGFAAGFAVAPWLVGSPGRPA